MSISWCLISEMCGVPGTFGNDCSYNLLVLCLHPMGGDQRSSFLDFHLVLHEGEKVNL